MNDDLRKLVELFTAGNASPSEARTARQYARLDERVDWYAELPGATPALAAAFKAAAIRTSVGGWGEVDEVATLYYEAARSVAHAEQMDPHGQAYEGIFIALQEFGDVPDFIIAVSPGLARNLGELARAMHEGLRPLAELATSAFSALARIVRKVVRRG